MSAPDGDLLIHRHLEGTLTSDEAETLNGLLKEDPSLARRLAELSVDVLQLRDLGAGEVSEPVRGEAAPQARTSWPKGPIAAAAAILLAVAVALIARSMQGPESPPESESVPVSRDSEGSWIADIDGFVGLVSGRIVKKGRQDVVLRVREVVQTNEAPRHAEALAGRAVVLKPGILRSDEGRERHDPVHEAFLRKLDVGMDLRIEVFHWRNGEFRIRALDSFQRDWVRVPREGDREGDERDRERKQDRTERPRRERDREPEEGRRESERKRGDNPRREGEREREGDRDEPRRRVEREGERKRESEEERSRRSERRDRED